MDELSRTHVTNVAALRAVAHPLRAMMLGVLRRAGPATATELARRFGESSGATSYHLRQLARYGFIVEDEEQPSHRERRWRAAAMVTSADNEDFVEDPAGRQALDAINELQIGIAARYGRWWRDHRLEFDRAWYGSAGSNDMEFRLTPDATRRLLDSVIELGRRLEQEGGDDASAQRVSVFIQAVPVDPEILPL